MAELGKLLGLISNNSLVCHGRLGSLRANNLNINQLRHCYCGRRDDRPTVVLPPLKRHTVAAVKRSPEMAGFWQHCMSGYCKTSGIRFNKILIFRGAETNNLGIGISKYAGE